MQINSQGLSLIFSIGKIVLALIILDKEEKRKKYKSMSSQERQELILKKMKAKGIEVGSGVLNKKKLPIICLLFLKESHGNE